MGWLFTVGEWDEWASYEISHQYFSGFLQRNIITNWLLGYFPPDKFIRANLRLPPTPLCLGKTRRERFGDLAAQCCAALCCQLRAQHPAQPSSTGKCSPAQGTCRSGSQPCCSWPGWAHSPLSQAGVRAKPGNTRFSQRLCPLCSALDGPPKKGSQRKWAAGGKCPTEKYLIQVLLKTSQYRFRFSFCLGEGTNNGSGWFLVKFNSQQKSCATQEWAKSMKGMCGWGGGGLEDEDEQRQRLRTVWFCPTGNDEAWTGLNVQQKQEQNRGAPAAAEQTQPSLVGEKIQDQTKSGKAIVKGWLQKVPIGPWLQHEKKIIDCQTEESMRSSWINLCLLELQLEQTPLHWYYICQLLKNSHMYEDFCSSHEHHFSSQPTCCI